MFIASKWIGLILKDLKKIIISTDFGFADLDNLDINQKSNGIFLIARENKDYKIYMITFNDFTVFLLSREINKAI